MEQYPDCFLTYGVGHRIEHIISHHLVLNKRISLTVRLKTDTLTELIHIVDVIHPLSVYYFQKDDTLDLSYLLGTGEFGFLGLINLDNFFLELMDKFFFLHIPDIRGFEFLNRNSCEQMLVKLRKIPVFGICHISDTHLDCVLHKLRSHSEYNVTHALTVKHTAALGIYNLSLLIHNLIVFEQVLSDSEVVSFYSLLRLLDGTGEHRVFYLFIFGNTECVKYVHEPVRTEQSHQIVFEGNKKS